MRIDGFLLARLVTGDVDLLAIDKAGYEAVFASVPGVLPFVPATGAGAGGRRQIGMTPFGGHLVDTVADLLVIPLLSIPVQSAPEAARWRL